MTLNKTGMRVGTAAIAISLMATACGGSSGGSGTGDGGDKPEAGAKGGELSLLGVADFEHLDPQRNYVSSALNFGRLIYRQLTTYKAEPGTAGTELAPDLATDLGKATDNAKTWTFTLKDGLKYEDGTPITSQDIKYGVERSMSPLIPDGPTYAKQYLAGTESYKGPYEGKELDSIETPDAKTIIFKLAAPHGDFGYTVSLPTFAPVPKAKDTKVNYDNRPFSSGPYMIKTYARGKSLELVRNPNWGQDDVRKALPDTVKAVFGLDPNVIDQRLLASAGTDANAFSIDSSVQPANVARVLSDAAVKDRSVSGTTGFLRYIALNTQKGVTKDLKVRQAINYAVNKIDQQTARGGPTAAGDPATTILAPTVGGHKDFNAYESEGDKGDVTKAKQLLSEAGFPNGFDITIACNNTKKAVDQAVALQASLAKVGIKGKINQIDAAVYYTTVGDAAKSPEIVFAAWGPDWPSAGTVIPPLLDGRQIKPQGNQNFSQLNDSGINDEMDRISAITDQEKAAEEWGKLDEKIMKEQAPFVPLLNDKAIFLFGKNVKGAFMHAFYGEIDVSAVGVK